jgi:hypothetical protein
MGRVNGHTADEVIDAIKKSHGIVASAARILGIDRSTVQRYINNYPTIKAALENEREVWTDIAESQLIRAVRKGSLPAVMFYLKTVGRNRGYIERQEFTGADGGAIEIIHVKPKSEDG